MRYRAHLFVLLQGLLDVQSIVRTKMRSLSRPQRLWKLSPIACAAVLAVQVLAGTAVAQPTSQPTLAPVHNEGVPSQLQGQYIVVFNPGTTRNVVAAAQARVKALGGTVMYTYTSSLIGFSVKLPAETGPTAERAVQALRALPGVAYIEADQRVTPDTIQPPSPPTNPPTGLDRIDRRLLPLNNTYTYSETGAGVHVYVIDSGIWIAHKDFAGRASVAFDALGGNGIDCFGHGTHVAGIIGGANFGVAKQVTLHALRVYDCFGGGAHLRCHRGSRLGDYQCDSSCRGEHEPPH
jgi:subtilisin family serine protease